MVQVQYLNYLCKMECVSSFFRLMAGVRQGGVLSPFLFAVFIYVDNLVDKVKATGVGCYFFIVLR